MDKKHLHHAWTRFRAVRPWYFLAIFILSGVVFVFALRHNYATMVGLKAEVYQADERGKGVEPALQNLRNYVYHHMNTSLSGGPNAVYPPIQLQHTYARIAASAGASPPKSNDQIYTDAQHYCEAKIPTGFSGRYRISCIQSYIKQHHASPVVAKTTVPEGLYKFDFVSAKWSPDLAGWSLVVTILSGLAFIASFAADRWFRKNVA